MIKAWLQAADIRIGGRLALSRPAYIEETILEPGGGVYTAEDWSRARASGYRDAGPDSIELSTDERYRRRMFSSHVRNTLAALRFARTFDLSQTDAVFELGCGEMIQAHVLTTIYPHLRYTATDFDPFVIERCSQLRTLDGIDKAVLDVTTLTPVSLAGIDLVLAWEMIYALRDSQVLTLLTACRTAGATFITGTTQLLGPMRSLLGKARRFRRPPSGRAHGWQQSVGVYRRLAQSCEMDLAVYYPPIRWAPEDNFVYLVFRPAA